MLLKEYNYDEWEIKITHLKILVSKEKSYW